MIRKENKFMADTNKETIEKVVKEEAKKEPRSLSVEEVFNQYPVDREKARDVLLMEISSSLLKIAASMETLPQALLGITQKLENLKKRSMGPG
jgi:hypothetical protein